MAQASLIGSLPPAGEPFVSKWSARYRGVRLAPPPTSHENGLADLALVRPPPQPEKATVQDLEPPAALSLNPSDPISTALASAFEREYTHLTVVDAANRALLGYVSMPALQEQLASGSVRPSDPVSAAMSRFRRHPGRPYALITLATPLEDLEAFFAGARTGGQPQDFAVVTDEDRRFVLGVATRDDLQDFVSRRPA